MIILGLGVKKQNNVWCLCPAIFFIFWQWSVEDEVKSPTALENMEFGFMHPFPKILNSE